MEIGKNSEINAETKLTTKKIKNQDHRFDCATKVLFLFNIK